MFFVTIYCLYTLSIYISSHYSAASHSSDNLTALLKCTFHESLPVKYDADSVKQLSLFILNNIVVAFKNVCLIHL